MNVLSKGLIGLLAVVVFSGCGGNVVTKLPAKPYAEDTLIMTNPPGQIIEVNGVKQPKYPKWITSVPKDRFVGRSEKQANERKATESAIRSAAEIYAGYLGDEVKMIHTQIAGDIGLDSSVMDASNIPVDIKNHFTKKAIKYLKAEKWFYEIWRDGNTGEKYWLAHALCFVDKAGKLSLLKEALQENKEKLAKERKQARTVEAKKKIDMAIDAYIDKINKLGQ